MARRGDKESRERRKGGEDERRDGSGEKQWRGGSAESRHKLEGKRRVAAARDKNTGVSRSD